MSELLLQHARIRDEQPPVDILIRDGRIVAVGPSRDDAAPAAAAVLDAQNRVVLPGFIESHIHPDKALLESRMPNRSGTLEEAIRNTGILKQAFTPDDVLDRASTVLRWGLSHGTTWMRVHPDVDPLANLVGLQAMLALKERFRGWVDVQVVAFPQEGIFKSPGTEALLHESLRLGADVVGGCPYNEATPEDTRRHIELVFALAEQYGKPIDMHVDFTDHVEDPRYLTADLIADLTLAHGMQGKVALGHATTLGALPPDQAEPLFDKLARAGITVAILPATDLFLNGRRARYNIPRGMAPLGALLAHGVNVVYSSNNVRNAFTPFGKADLLLVGYLLAQTQHMGSADQQRKVLDLITVHAAQALGIADRYGIAPGKVADLVVLDTLRVSDVIQDQAVRWAVIKGGRIVAQNRLQTSFAAGLP